MEKMLLKRSVSCADVARALSALGMTLDRERQHEGNLSQLWRLGDGLLARHDETGVLGVSALFVDGRDEWRIASKLRKALPHWPRNRIIAGALSLLGKRDAEQTSEEAEEWATLLAIDVLLRGFCSASVALLRAFVGSPNVTTRKAGALALWRLAQPELRGVARLVAEHGDPEVATIGEELVARIAERHGPGDGARSEKLTRSVQSMMAISYASDLLESKAAWERRLSEPLREIAAAQASRTAHRPSMQKSHPPEAPERHFHVGMSSSP